MTVLGAHVPVSVWTVVVLGVGGVVSFVWFRRRRAVLGVGLSLTVALALTVTPEGHEPAFGVAACIPFDWNDFVFNVFHTGGGVFANLLNLVLLVPLAFFLVLATRRVWPAVVVGLVLPFVIEVVQTQLPGRSCAITDYLTNVAGAMVGVLIAVRARGSGRPRPDPTAGTARRRRRWRP